MMRIIFIFGLFLLFIFNPIQAQTQIVSYCGQLSEADCALMLDGQQSLMEMRSATLNPATFTIVSEGDGLVFEIGAQGSVANLPVVRSHERVMLGDFRAEATLSFDLSGSSPEWRDLVAFESVDMRLIDGILYIDLESLEPAPTDPLLHGWVRYDLSTQFPEFGAEPPPTPNPNIETHELPLNGTDLARLVAAFSPEVIDDFVTIVRDGDMFETRMDFPAMYANPDVREVLHQQLPDVWWRYSPKTQGPIADEDLDRLAATVAEFYPEPVALYGWSVNPATRQVHGFRYWATLGFEHLVEAAVFPDDRERPTSQLQFWMRADFDDYNAAVEIVTPPDAQPLTSEIFVLLFPGLADRMGIDKNGE